MGECSREYDKDKNGDEGDSEPASGERLNTQKSCEIMDAYLKEGELNPQIVATKSGFLRIFSAWILDEDLPWTTGEAPTLQMLFKYLKINHQLPSDTSVRNQLAKVFVELHGKVVKEFTVRLFTYYVLTISLHPVCYLQDCLLNRHLDH